MNVLADNFHDLTIKNGNIKTSLGTVAVTGNFVVASSTILILLQLLAQ